MSKEYKSKNYLEQQYVAHRLSALQIADICGTSEDTIRYWIKKYNIVREKVRRSRRKINKKAAIDYLGSCCSICGYKKCQAALQFHHVFPENKSYNISAGLGQHWKTLKGELDKCLLLCSNCHTEVHAGIVSKNIILEIFRKK